MQAAISFNNVLEAAEQLSLTEQETLIDILRRRLAEKRRNELLNELQDARREYQMGQASPATADEIMEELLS